MSYLICYLCGIQFGVPDIWLECRHQDQRTFWCPNGHDQLFGTSTTEILLREKEELRKKLQAQINDERHLRLVAEKERDTERRKRRKVERRIAAGVCPCCNRSFKNLHRHMETKHKGYALPPANPKEITGTVQ